MFLKILAWMLFLYLFVTNLLAYKFYTPRPNSGCEEYVCTAASCPQSEKYILKEEDDVEVVNVDDFDERCLNHMNESSATGFCSGFRYVYNPYKDLGRRKSNLPACVRCAQCLAVAEEVNQLFKSIIGDERHVEPIYAKKTINRKFSEDFCKSTFTSYDLRNCNGKPKFARMGACGTHIRTEFDGQWPAMLRKLCLLFVHQLDCTAKYNFFHQHWTGRITSDDFLCRGDGVFRECKNLHNATTESSDDTIAIKGYWETCVI